MQEGLRHNSPQQLLLLTGFRHKLACRQAGASLNSAFKQHRRDKMEQAVNTMRVLLVACGTWKIHLSRLQDRLAGSKTWVEFDGTSVTRRAWDGRANLEEFETDSPTGHIEGLTLRVYNPQTHQWSIYWANSEDPALGQPLQPMLGEFKNGRASFTIRNYGRADQSMFDLCGRTSPRIQPTLSSRIQMTEGRPGK
jgi:hypothetical protein